MAVYVKPGSIRLGDQAWDAAIKCAEANSTKCMIGMIFTLGEGTDRSTSRETAWMVLEDDGQHTVTVQNVYNGVFPPTQLDPGWLEHKLKRHEIKIAIWRGQNSRQNSRNGLRAVQ